MCFYLPEPYAVLERLAYTDSLNYRYLSKYDMKGDNEMTIFKAIRENDVGTLKEILQNPSKCKLSGRNEKIPVLFAAVLKGECDVVKFLIDQGCDMGEIDKDGNTPLHLLTWNKMKSYDYYYRGYPGSPHDRACHGCELGIHRSDILEIFLSSYTDRESLIDSVFMKANKFGMTPFLSSCASGCDVMITRFLSLIDNRSISIDRFIGYDGNNSFHFLLDSSTYFMPPTRLDTIRTMTEKLPRAHRLMDAKNATGATPLHLLLFRNCVSDQMKQSEIAKIFFGNGVCPEKAFLDRAISKENIYLVEVLLRAGCCDFSESTLLGILDNRYGKSISQKIAMIELLLSFGYDLGKEEFLCTGDLEVDPHILASLRDLQKLNKMLSLQRQCRNTIRHYLKGKADQVIGDLDCIPDLMKSFLMVKNEKPLLLISEK